MNASADPLPESTAVMPTDEGRFKRQEPLPRFVSRIESVLASDPGVERLQLALTDVAARRLARRLVIERPHAHHPSRTLHTPLSQEDEILDHLIARLRIKLDAAGR